MYYAQNGYFFIGFLLHKLAFNLELKERLSVGLAKNKIKILHKNMLAFMKASRKNRRVHLDA